MLHSPRACLCGGLLTLLSALTVHAATGTDSNPIVSAVRRGNCDQAVKALNALVNGPDGAYALFIGGRLLDEGICVKQDPIKAASYFARGAALGEADAQLDYAAKAGLGEGRPQDYVSAGFECHKGGVDPTGLLPFYSVGYACTVRAVAGRLLRMSLPPGALESPAKPAVVEFNALSGELRIISTPSLAAGYVSIESHRTRSPLNPNEAIQKAWRDALATVPKADEMNLTSDPIQLSVDMDATLEAVPIPAVKPTQMSALPPGNYVSRPMPMGGMMMH
jgi:hypothetical protein